MTAANVIVSMAKAALNKPNDPPVYPAHVQKDPPTRYVVVYPGDSLAAEDLAHTSDTVKITWQVTCVGQALPDVVVLRDRVRAAFVDVRLVVPGLSCGVVSHVGSQPIRPDTNIPGRVVLYSTDQFECIATRA